MPTSDAPRREITRIAEFIGVAHILQVKEGGFESVRCSDGEVVKGQFAAAGE